MFTASEIAKTLSIDIGTLADPQSSIQNIRIDSRKVLPAEHCLFVALKGERTDGHQFVSDAYSRGARNFLVQKGEAIELPADANLFSVSDVITGLQAIAMVHRKKHHIPVIGITGSNGKTCLTCHEKGLDLDVNLMDKRNFEVMGVKVKDPADAVNFCIEVALRGEGIDPQSKEMANMLAWLAILATKSEGKKYDP